MKILRAIFAVLAGFCLLLPGYADNVQDHRIAQTRPIQLGTSGGNVNDESAQFCCSGTLGALVQNRKGRLFMLSNNHVLARTNRSRKRELVTQPGLVDANCLLSADAAVANLSKFRRIRFSERSVNVVDAAIAEVLPGQVDPIGNIIGIGMLNTGTVEAAVGLAVKKSGRTTGLTQGIIAAVDVTILVSYDTACGVGSQIAQFAHQIRISPNNFGDFSQGGDSGALVVEDVGTCPRAVGLLFAGGGGNTFANPIVNVLSKLKVSLVGCSSTSNAAAVALTHPVFRRRVSAESFFACKSVKDAAETDVLKIPGVVGVGIGISDADPAQATVEVYSAAEPSDIRKQLPATLQSVPLKIVPTGTIHAL